MHRQTLYTDTDVGRSKIERAKACLETLSPELSVSVVEGRFVPERARALLEGHDLVVEGADNLATKFLVADAARISGIPAVQGGAVRWAGWAFCALPDAACLRCLFEDIPRDRIDVDLGIVVDEFLQSSVPGIYAAGDTAEAIEAFRSYISYGASPRAASRERIAAVA